MILKGTAEKKTVTTPSKNTTEKEKEKNIGNYKALCAKTQAQKTRMSIAKLFAFHANAITHG